jgi:peroxiredoxin
MSMRFKLHLQSSRVLAIPIVLGLPSFAAVQSFPQQRTAPGKILREGGHEPSRRSHYRQEHAMIKVGDRLPEGTLTEFIETETAGCSLGPNSFKVSDLVKGKKIAIFGLPGAYTPTCSAKHVPSYLANYDKLKTRGVDEIWCISVNDAFVMGAWGRDQKATGKIRMMADGSAEFTKKLGLELDLTARGMGVRMNRISMLVDDGLVKQLNVEGPGKFEVSDAETMLKQL